MYSGLVSKTTPVIDLLTVLTGSWDERNENGWHIVMTPFFVTMDRPVDAGSVALPYKVKVPTAALLCGKSGNVSAMVIKPNDTALSVPEDGYVRISVFGSGASQLQAVR